MSWQAGERRLHAYSLAIDVLDTTRDRAEGGDRCDAWQYLLGNSCGSEAIIIGCLRFSMYRERQ